MFQTPEIPLELRRKVPFLVFLGMLITSIEVLIPFYVRILSSPLDKSLKIDKMSTVRTVRTFVWDKLLICPEDRISNDN